MSVVDSSSEAFSRIAKDETLSFVLWLIAHGLYNTLDELLSDPSSCAPYIHALEQLRESGMVAFENVHPRVTSLGIEVLLHMGMAPVTTSQLASLLRSGHLTIVLGSDTLSNYVPDIPSRYAISKTIIRLLGEPMGSDVEHALRFAHQIPLEVVVDIMAEVFNRRDITRPLGDLFQFDTASSLHRFLAWTATAFGNVVLDLGYNAPFRQIASGLSGRATINDYSHYGIRAEWNSQNGLIIQTRVWNPQDKRRGRLLDKVLAIRQPKSAELLRRLFENHAVLLVGTGIEDEGFLSLIRTLLVENPSKIFWLVDKKAKDINNPVELHRWLAQSGGGYEEADLESALREVYSIASNSGSADQQLDLWHPLSAKEDFQGSQLDRLYSQIQSGYSDMFASHPFGQLVAWAKLLEHLHEVETAIHAYEAALDHAVTDLERLSIGLRIAVLSRTSGNFNDALDRLHVIRRALMSSSGDKLRAFSRKTNLILGSTLHQIGVTYQMLQDHERADIELRHAQELRGKLADLELPYTVFQRFLNAVRHHEYTGKPVDVLAPSGWRSWMPKALDTAAEDFSVKSLWRHRASMLHNVAFVRAFLGSEARIREEVTSAQETYEQALYLALEAAGIRRFMFERRMIAQSEVLAAKCARERVQLTGWQESSPSITRIYDSARQQATELYASMKVPEYQRRVARRPEELLLPT